MKEDASKNMYYFNGGGTYSINISLFFIKN